MVSDNFTIENLDEVSTIVKSDILPLTMIEWPCKAPRILEQEKQDDDYEISLLEHAVLKDDMELLKLIIGLGSEQQALLALEHDGQKCYTIKQTTFGTAIRLGRTIMLAEIIKATGAGIPFNEIIKKRGIKLKSKPKYYQGESTLNHSRFINTQVQLRNSILIWFRSHRWWKEESRLGTSS